MSRQKLGQHFLSDISWRKRIAETLPAAPGSVWIEIGAGHGEMTELLAKRAHRVIAIETDATLVPSLRNRAARWSANVAEASATPGPPAKTPGPAATEGPPATAAASAATEVPTVEIVHADVLSLNLAALVSHSAKVPHPAATSPQVETLKNYVIPNPGRSLTGVRNLLLSSAEHDETNRAPRFRVYGNLPYYITSPILAHLFRFAAQIDSIHIVTQLEVAQRIAAHPGSRDYGYLSTLCQYYARPELLFRIPPGAFNPPPKVTSALLEMQLPGECASLGIADDAPFLKFLQACFAQKRKTLRNNLRGTYAQNAIANALAAGALTHTSRAEELTLRQFAQLFAQLNAEGSSTSLQKPVRLRRTADRDNSS